MTRRGTEDRGQGTESAVEPAATAVELSAPDSRARDGEPLGITGVSFLNARPLVAGLEAALPAPFFYTYRSLPPADCAAEFAAGRVLASLVPVGSLPSLPPAQLLPALGIACRGAVQSVLLVSKVEPERIASLAVDRASATSVALARTLLVARWGARAEVLRAAPPLQSMLDDVDAAVIIGDPALAVHGRTGLLEIDLGAAWVEWTGLPFVFAVWALAPGAPPALVELLTASHVYSQQHWDELTTRWAGAHEFPCEVVRSYLEHNLVHVLAEPERAGMLLFLERAAECGVLPRHVPTWLDQRARAAGARGAEHLSAVG
jgi:chorismate dehydratase